MNFDRKGELLWSEWDGEGYTVTLNHGMLYVTEGHVSLDEPVVSRALASAVQREGVVDSIGQAHNLIENWSFVSWGYAGVVDGDTVQTTCDELGETYYGDIAENVVPVTFVEVSFG
jgi:hypothetical protein